MSYAVTRNSILTALLSRVEQIELVLGYPIGIAHENDSFDPTGYKMWLAYAYTPTTSESMGKIDTDSDDERGFFQVSCYIETGNQTLYNEQLAFFDMLKSEFKSGSLKNAVIIDSATINGGRTQDNYFVRDMTINYKTFIKRV